MRILLAEDDVMLGQATRAGLMQDGYSVDWVRDGASFRQALLGEEYAAVLLDIGLPDVTGFELLREMRERSNATAVIVITARDHTADKVRMLDLGADDYVPKPFDLDELSARVRAVTRRAVGTSTMLLKCGPIELDLAGHTARWRGAELTLTVKEYRLIEALMRQRGRVLSRQQLEQALYGYLDEVESNAIEVHIHHLRRKTQPDLIKTVRGVGYQLGLDADAT
jgi:DNA-binding response OmpR family regulator